MGRRAATNEMHDGSRGSKSLPKLDPNNDSPGAKLIMARTVSAPLHALDALANPKLPFSAMTALFGDDRFLQLEALQHLQAVWLGADQAEFATTRLAGDEIQWPDMFDALCTGSLFSGSGRRLVIVDAADDFVKNQRSALEELAEQSWTNGLVLCVGSWPSNTRLFKLFAERGLQIDCNPPTVARGKSKQVNEGRIGQWLIERARTRYQFELSTAAARQLMDLSECSFGLFDQQLAKLACYADSAKPIAPENVRDWIGGWRINTVWQTIDSAVDGDAATALLHLNRLLQSGEHPLALLGQISWSLRRYGEALELFDRGQRRGEGVRLSAVLAPAGFRPWGGELESAESRLKKLGPQRTRKILRWLLETDTALKGSHSHESRGRFALERLIAKLAVPLSSASSLLPAR